MSNPIYNSYQVLESSPEAEAAARRVFNDCFGDSTAPPDDEPSLSALQRRAVVGVAPTGDQTGFSQASYYGTSQGPWLVGQNLPGMGTRLSFSATYANEVDSTPPYQWASASTGSPYVQLGQPGSQWSTENYGGFVGQYIANASSFGNVASSLGPNVVGALPFEGVVPISHPSMTGYDWNSSVRYDRQTSYLWALDEGQDAALVIGDTVTPKPVEFANITLTRSTEDSNNLTDQILVPQIPSLTRRRPTPVLSLAGNDHTVNTTHDHPSHKMTRFTSPSIQDSAASTPYSTGYTSMASPWSSATPERMSTPDMPVQRVMSSRPFLASEHNYTLDRLPPKDGGGGRVARSADAELIPASHSGPSPVNPDKGEGKSGTRPLNGNGMTTVMPQANQGLPDPQKIIDLVSSQEYKHWGEHVYALVPEEWAPLEVGRKSWTCRWRRSIIHKDGRRQWTKERQCCYGPYISKETCTRHIKEQHVGLRRERKTKSNSSSSSLPSLGDKEAGPSTKRRRLE